MSEHYAKEADQKRRLLGAVKKLRRTAAQNRSATKIVKLTGREMLKSFRVTTIRLSGL
jgi:hypothetical protein